MNSDLTEKNKNSLRREYSKNSEKATKEPHFLSLLFSEDLKFPPGVGGEEAAAWPRSPLEKWSIGRRPVF